MILYISLTVAVVCVGLLVKKENLIVKDGKNVLTKQGVLNKMAAALVFLLLFAVSALRIGVGNDYWVYKLNFELIEQERVVSSEIGFNLIVKLFTYLFSYGERTRYIAIFAFMAFLTCLFYVKGIRRNSEWFAASLFLLMTNGFYFGSLNSVRYFLALAMAMYSIYYLLKEDYLKFLLIIFVAAFFHKSVLIVLPMYLIAKLKFKKWHLIPIAVCCAGLILFKDIVRKIVFIVYPFYEGSYLDDGEISWVNIAKAVAILIFSLIYYKKIIKEDGRLRFFFQLNIVALIIFSCLWFIPETTRIGYYASISNIFFLPAVIKRIPDKRDRIFWSVCIGAAYGAFFILYLRSCYAVNVRLLPYYSWLYI